MSEVYIAALDVGTTTIRCHIINSLMQVVGSSNSRIQLIYPEIGYVEIDPNQLWEQVMSVVKCALSDANLTPKDIKCLGISTQRATFTTWRRDTGVPLHNFITWKDIRAKELCKELNSSLKLQTLRLAAYSLHIFTRSERLLTGSKLKISTDHVTGRLLWIIRNSTMLREAIEQKNAMFGTVDTWLLYKFSNRKLHITDVSNAAATGFFDPFSFEWGSWAKIFLGVPEEILPKIVNNDYEFGETDQSIFGAPIPIQCVMADQSSSMFGSCCFEPNDIKITLGTGAFLDVNTGNKIHNGVTGMYPVVAWKLKQEVIYNGEVSCNDCGSLIEWLLKVGLIKDPFESSEIAVSVKDNDGIYFIPAFSGLGPPINDVRAASGFLGIKPTTTKNHLVRSVLEAIAYRLFLVYRTLEKERQGNYQRISVDGGVSKNNFICQMLADLSGLKIERLHSSEMSVLGVGLVAGLNIGLWKSLDQLRKLRNIESIFSPSSDKSYREKCKRNFEKWLNVVERFKSWYDED